MENDKPGSNDPRDTNVDVLDSATDEDFAI